MALPKIFRSEVPPDELDHSHKYSCPPTYGCGNPYPQPAEAISRRVLLDTLDLDLPESDTVRMWIICNPLYGATMTVTAIP